MPARKRKAAFIEPMLLQAQPTLPEGWLYELKLDGYRAIAGRVGGAAHLRSRNDNDFARTYPTITAALKSLPDDTVVFPGHGPRTTVGTEKESNPFVAAVAR